MTLKSKKMYNFLSGRIIVRVTGGIVVPKVTFLAAEPPREARAAEPPREARAAKPRGNVNLTCSQSSHGSSAKILQHSSANPVSCAGYKNNLPLGFNGLCFQK